MVMLQKSMRQPYLTLIYSLEDFLASLSQLLENEKDLTIPEEHSFLISHGFLPTKNQSIWYSKMLKVYYLMTRDVLSRQSLGFLPTLGITCRGRSLIVKPSAFHKTVKESSLSALIPGAKRTPLRFLKRNQKNIVGDYSFTVDVGDTGGVEVDGVKRKLTPEEKELLQGFPRGWTAGYSERVRGKMMGNAVTVPVVKYIISKIFTP